ncbi:MAG: ABC transporter permease [Vicinamibacteria bacterium]|nr:ABC transporter permease [Vicinamibacteria bacterium]
MRWTGLRLATRRLLHAPLFTVVTLLTLAIGIGANTAIFSVVYGVLLKPLPFAEPDRLVAVWHRAPGLGFEKLNQSPSTYLTVREQGRVFQDIGIWRTEAVSITGRGEPERVQGLMVTDGTLPLLGVAPTKGRPFTRADDAPGTPRRVILTHGYWQRRFGGADIIGQSMAVDGEPLEVIGVLPPTFRFLNEDPSIVLPLQFDRAKIFVGNFSYMGLARLKPGVTIAQANADLERLLPGIPDQFPLPPGFTRKMYDELKMAPNIYPLAQDAVGDVGTMLWILLGTVGMVLLIACANVANLCLVRAEGRHQEFAVRTALGASRWQIARSLLSESVTLGLLGGVLGVLVARAGLSLLVWLAPDGLPRLNEIEINGVVLLFTFGISLLAGLLFGLIPVLRFGEPSVTALKEGGRSASDGPTRHRARNTLVVAEIALALVLLVVSGLMIRSFQALRAIDPGFRDPEHVQTFRISVPDAVVADPNQAVRTHQQIAEQLARVPGVTSVGLSSALTMDGYDSNDPIFVEGITPEGGAIPPLRRFKWIAPGYVETMGNRVIAGRMLTWNDAYQRLPVVAISENLAREYWKTPGEALGKRIRNTPASPWREIVGVVGNERDNGLHVPAPAIVYWPMAIDKFWDETTYVNRNMAYAIRSERLQSASFLRELQQAVWSVNANLPVANPRSLAEIRAESMAQTSFALTMLGIAAAVALLLGVVGIYGVIAYIAAQRTREIGVRMALGAQASDVRRLFVGHGLKLVAIGLVLGVAAAMSLTRLMSTLLFGVGPMDPITYVAVSFVLGTVALVATYLPARRAARVDPVVALRADA